MDSPITGHNALPALDWLTEKRQNISNKLLGALLSGRAMIIASFRGLVKRLARPVIGPVGEYRR
jgi:hypothetical protein